MNINRKKQKITQIKVEHIKIGACFLYHSMEDLYIRTTGKHNKDPIYVVSATRLSDGLENKFQIDAMVWPVGATVWVEE